MVKKIILFLFLSSLLKAEVLEGKFEANLMAASSNIFSDKILTENGFKTGFGLGLPHMSYGIEINRYLSQNFSVEVSFNYNFIRNTYKYSDLVLFDSFFRNFSLGFGFNYNISNICINILLTTNFVKINSTPDNLMMEHIDIQQACFGFLLGLHYKLNLFDNVSILPGISFGHIFQTSNQLKGISELNFNLKLSLLFN